MPERGWEAESESEAEFKWDYLTGSLEQFREIRQFLDAKLEKKMDLIEDSLINDSDWSSIGLENSLWDTLSDKG